MTKLVMNEIETNHNLGYFVNQMFNLGANYADSMQRCIAARVLR